MYLFTHLLMDFMTFLFWTVLGDRDTESYVHSSCSHDALNPSQKTKAQTLGKKVRKPHVPHHRCTQEESLDWEVPGGIPWRCVINGGQEFPSQE